MALTDYGKQKVKRTVEKLVRSATDNIVQPSLAAWFYRWIQRQNTYCKEWSPKNVYFEFGVAGGSSLVEYIEAVQRYCRTTGASIKDFRIVGFDSFSGLPPKQDAADDHLDWVAGRMSHGKDEVLGKIERLKFPLSQVQLIPGYFENSLTPALWESLQCTPSIVTLDCDYYSSTRTVLDWLEPKIHSGTAMYFDDIWSFHGSPHHGQLKAIDETNARGAIFLRPCHIFGFEHHSYLCSRREWEYGNRAK